MAKVKIPEQAFIYPMPMVLVGTRMGEKVNFMAVGWVTRVNHKPPLMMVAINKIHLTNEHIRNRGKFSVNIPHIELLEKTDCCGLVSGRKSDKSKLFDIFYGNLEDVPMINDCPLCLECELVRAIDLPTNTMFVGEIKGAWCEETFLADGKPDLEKLKPFTLTMPDNNYWAAGERLGKAWSVGRDLRKEVVFLEKE